MSRKPAILAANTTGTMPSLKGTLALAFAIFLILCDRLCNRLHQKTNNNKSKSSSELLTVVTS